MINTMAQSNPIFIGGDGRSGTTLLSLILNSHPDLTVGPELHFNGPENLGPCVLECAQLLADGDERVFGKGIKENPHLKKGVQFAKRCHRFGLSFELLSILINQSMEETNSRLAAFSDRCHLINSIGEARRLDTSGTRWGIKIMREIGAIKKYTKCWKNAQFIHIVRDGRDVAASQMKEHGGWGYADVKQAAKTWSTLLRRVKKELGVKSVIEIRYEDLVLQPRETTERLTEFLGCEWDSQMLNHSDMQHSLYENPYNHPSINSVVKPINDSAIGRHTQDLTPEQIGAFNKIASRELINFNYDVIENSV